MAKKQTKNTKVIPDAISGAALPVNANNLDPQALNYNEFFGPIAGQMKQFAESGKRQGNMKANLAGTSAFMDVGDYENQPALYNLKDIEQMPINKQSRRTQDFINSLSDEQIDALTEKRGKGFKDKLNLVKDLDLSFSQIGPAITAKNYFKDAGLNIFENGGYMPGSYMLPEYGFGSWLKKNAAGLMKGAGSLVGLIPGIGEIAGPVLNIAGSAIAGNQQKKEAEAQAAEQAKLLEEQQQKEQHQMDLNIANENLVNDDVFYGATFANGGDLGAMMMNQNPMITEYSKKANKHNEGIGGVPVDERGNPTNVSNSSAVGLTEGGEVTWNGYVFSDKLKVNKKK
jgi:hypothetical protein